MKNPCVAHRGWSSRAPENTMAAIRLALADPLIEWIEIDVHLSKDHVPMVIHDYTLRRTTDGKGDVKKRRLTSLLNWMQEIGFHKSIKASIFRRLLRCLKNRSDTASLTSS